MNTKFYEEECLPRVKSIAESLDYLCENSTDKDELEEKVEKITTDWQDALFEALQDTDDEINAYGLEGEELLSEMDERGVKPEESDIADYNDLCEQLRELENIGASDLFEYFNDCFDIEYAISGSGDYLGVCVWVAVGGPGIWVDTRDRAVKLAWGCERVEWGINSDTADKIDEIFEEQYRCIR